MLQVRRPTGRAARLLVGFLLTCLHQLGVMFLNDLTGPIKPGVSDMHLDEFKPLVIHSPAFHGDLAALERIQCQRGIGGIRI